jgi:ribose 5-phosphate isomerase B
MGKNLKIGVGSDHGGLDLKNQLLSYLQSRGYFVQDCGTHTQSAVDYPRIAYTVAHLVSSGSCDRGILVILG